MRRHIGTMVLMFSLVLLAGRSTFTAEDLSQRPPAAQPAVDFLRDVEPILQKNCYACHGPGQQMNGFRLDQKEAALKGGYSGTAIQPGKSSESLLIKKVSSSKDGFKMPPAGSALTAAEIGVLSAWIDQGAVWPAQPLATAKTSFAERKSY